MGAGVTSRHLIDWDREGARRRLEHKERIQDPKTVAYLDRIGVGEGWRCLEVGAGRGSIAAWLCRRVGAAGQVVAIDLDATFLRQLELPNLLILEQDVVANNLEEAAFDLVHARDVLMHIPERDSVLDRMAGAVKPGGWILVEEPDVSTDAADPTAPDVARKLYARVMEAIYLLLRDAGLDPNYGSRVLGRLQKVEFESLAAESWCQTYTGGPDCESPHVAVLEKLIQPITSQGSVSVEDFLAFLGLIRDPSFSWREGLTVSTWGRRPPRPVHATRR